MSEREEASSARPAWVYLGADSMVKPKLRPYRLRHLYRSAIVYRTCTAFNLSCTILQPYELHSTRTIMYHSILYSCEPFPLFRFRGWYRMCLFLPSFRSATGRKLGEPDGRLPPGRRATARGGQMVTRTGLTTAQKGSISEEIQLILT